MTGATVLRSHPAPAPIPAVSRRRQRGSVQQGRYRILTIADDADLLAYFRTLSMRERIARFQGGMSDAALAAYVLSIDWDSHWIVADAPCGPIASVVELVAHPIEGWTRCELALSLASQVASHQVRAELVQIAILAARDLGAEWIELLHERGRPTTQIIRLFPDFSSAVRVDEDATILDLRIWFGS